MNLQDLKPLQAQNPPLEVNPSGEIRDQNLGLTGFSFSNVDISRGHFNVCLDTCVCVDWDIEIGAAGSGSLSPKPQTLKWVLPKN